tara:strand:+ start:1154 stop:1681 length:528 start_codon:yes stop_codon:yes gene_type:complete
MNNKSLSLLEQIEKYLVDVLEEPRDEYEGLPACPFVKKERIKSNLMIDLFDNNKENFLEKIEVFANSNYTDAVFAQTINTMLSTKESKTYQNFLNGLLKQHFKQYKVIIVNPNDKFNVQGFNPRSLAPCILIVVTDRKKLSKAHKKMLKSKYFTNFNDDYLKYLHVKKEDIKSKQ